MGVFAREQKAVGAKSGHSSTLTNRAPASTPQTAASLSSDHHPLHSTSPLNT